MNDIKKLKVTIQGVTYQEEYKRYSVKTNNGTYSFFTEKKDGGTTKAMESYQELQVAVGMEIGVAYSESPNKRDESKPFRNVKWFMDASKVEETPSETTQAPSQQDTPLKADLDPTKKVWDSKDRMHMAQTAMNCAAQLYQGQGNSEVKTIYINSVADQIYSWLLEKKEGKVSVEEAFEKSLDNDDTYVSSE